MSTDIPRLQSKLLIMHYVCSASISRFLSEGDKDTTVLQKNPVFRREAQQKPSALKISLFCSLRYVKLRLSSSVSTVTGDGKVKRDSFQGKRNVTSYLHHHGDIQQVCTSSKESFRVFSLHHSLINLHLLELLVYSLICCTIIKYR